MYNKAFELSYKNKKVEIEIQDFVGDVRNINGTEDLFSLSYISDSKDKGQSILVTEADINFYADDYFNIDELKTVGETDIKAKYYEDDSLLWSGFVIPDFFSTSVDIAPVVSMVATDRVGTLKEISNNAESNIPIQILASCLKQTGQDLPINLIIGNNHFETPIQLERIEEIASYDVIRTFMVLFNCKITLYKNAWWIINKKLLETGFINYKSYNSDGAGGSITSFAQPILNIDLVDRGGQREIKPTASEISLFLEFGGSKKYPDNWNFEKLNKTAKLFDSWSNHAGFEQGWRDKRILFYVYDSGYYNAWFTDEDTDKISLWYRAYWYKNKISDNILDYPNLKSSSVNVPKEKGFIDIALNGNFTTRDGMPIWIVPLIHNKTNGNYFTYNKEGVILKIGGGTPNLNQSNFDYVHNPRASSQNGFNPDDWTHESVDVNWDIKNTFDLRDFGSDSDEIEMQVVFLGGVYLQGALDLGIDIFINSVQISFNDSQVTGKGLIFKIKQGGEKFSKSREPETILFSDKINQGVNGYFYNYKYDDTSIVDLPSEFALSSVRERADMFSKARDYYSLDGDFIVNPLAKYKCGLKSFVLVGGENRREDAGIIVEEIVSNTLNRTDFIYTYFDDGKDKVKTIGTASGGSSSSGGGGAVSTPQLWKVDGDGNIYTEYNAYSLKNLSAFGFEDEQGDGDGGGSMDRLDTWASYDASKSGWVLSAFLGNDLNTRVTAIDGRVTDLENSAGSGSVTSVGISVPTGLSVSNSPITSSGVIAIGLQDGYSIPTTAKQEQWDGVVTDFAGLEIGGRNLIKRSDILNWNNFGLIQLSQRVDDFGSYYRYYFGVLTSAGNIFPNIEFKENTQYVFSAEGKLDTGILPFFKVRYTDGSSSGNLFYTGTNKPIRRDYITEEGKTIDYIEHAHNTNGFARLYNIQLIEGNKIRTDWTPAPEDQVSDWLTTDVNSFSFIKNKPTTLSGYGITDAYTKTQVDSSLALKLNKLTFDDLFEKVETSAGKWAVKVKYNLFSVGEISAFGLGEEGGGSGGGSMNMMQDWAFTTATENYYLPAKLAVPFYNEARSRLSTLEAGTAPASHTHPISDITGLQTSLNSKLETSIFNTHNNDNIRHITGVERTKWDGVVTDFAGLEIGGRNLRTGTYSDWRGMTMPAAYGITTPFLAILDDWRGKRATHAFEVKDVPAGEAVRIRIDFHTNASDYVIHIHGNVVYIEGKSYVTYTIPADTQYTMIRIRVSPVSFTSPYNFSFRCEKLEFGTKATDWTPAPEDQVSDWLTTDVNSFSFIKNKPTLLSQFTDNIGVATHIANKANPHSVTKAQVGLGNVTNESKATMFTNPTFTGTTKVTILELNSNWKVLKSGNELEFRYNNVKKATLTPNGDLIVMGGMTAYQ